MGSKVLVAYATKEGSTAEIAEAIGRTLREAGLDAEVSPVTEVADVSPYRAVLVGSAVYMMRWRREAVRFLKRHRTALAERPVWLFHSGPLDRDPEHAEQPLPRNLRALAEEIGAHGVTTFGGRIREDAKGFAASKVAKNAAGDYRDWDAIRAWARDLAPRFAA
jgi:menaquinone-dependent protoporphyrinogen oxidase